MTKQELFAKYKIDESHNAWDNRIDSWYSVEIYRAIHDGQLPPPDNKSFVWVTEFLDKCFDNPRYMMSFNNWGSYYLTAKRMVYAFADQILFELENK